MRLIGIDPGASTGLALYEAGELRELHTIAPHQIAWWIADLKVRRVIFEDSRLQSHTWTRGKSVAATAKMARNVGQIDAWCNLIEAVCADMGIMHHGVSPAGKGAKLDAARFELVTGWTSRSNQHERDGAMVAWPYRRAAP